MDTRRLALAPQGAVGYRPGGRSEHALRGFDSQLVDAIKKQRVLLPFLAGLDGTPPPSIGSNLTGTERFDQIFLLMRSRGADTPRIAEYGVFDIPSLVKSALKRYRLMDKTRTDRIRQQISDHVPIWIRLKLPDPLKE